MARNNTVYGVHAPYDGSPFTYYIQNNATGLYYVWCYSSLAKAHDVADRVYPSDELDIITNWRISRSECLTFK